MCYEIANEEGRIAVELTGPVRVKEATEVRERLFPMLLQGFTLLTFDLGGVTEMDSSGYGLLLAAQSIAAERQAEIAFVGVDEKLRNRCMQAGIKL